MRLQILNTAVEAIIDQIECVILLEKTAAFMAGASNFFLSDSESIFFGPSFFLTFGSFQIRQCCLDQPAHSRRCRQAPPRTGPRLHRGLH